MHQYHEKKPERCARLPLLHTETRTDGTTVNSVSYVLMLLRETFVYVGTYPITSIMSDMNSIVRRGRVVVPEGLGIGYRPQPSLELS